ncbi:DUF418 domain-containing protein [Viridibacillus sp. YIM B01967]|uniref:DUF418 domain-containing protein n=2 Tax=Viridibacillus soli TaxID=2798301 RepID=A0ABS1H6W0_9BACL|nr:DUF418 domain-containing protein [Viridibacillus soli]
MQKRIEALDMMRGFSLLGIFLVNMFAFSTPLPHIDLKTWFEAPLDKNYHQWLDIFVQGSFYPLFSMLFGYGLAMQFTKATKLGDNFYKIGSKRLAVLLGIGLLHAFLIWWGDILMTYAFCGFFLLALLRLKPVWLMTIGGALYGIVHGFLMVLMGLASLIEESSDMAQYVDIAAIEGAIAAYGSGSWTDAFIQRLADLQVQASPGMWIISLFTILPYMLLGAAASKWQLVERAKEKRVFWIILTVITIPVGVTIKMLPYNLERNLFLDYVQVSFGGPILAVGYAGLIVLLCQIPNFTKIFSPVAKAGRMSMTTYLMQSIIGTFIFYHFGLGLYGKIGVDTVTWLAVGIFVLQVVFAELWFLKFKQGPVEAVWKRITYGKKIQKKEEISQ